LNINKQFHRTNYIKKGKELVLILYH